MDNGSNQVWISLYFTIVTSNFTVFKTTSYEVVFLCNNLLTLPLQKKGITL